MALGFDGILRLVVFNAVGLQGQTRAAQASLAFDHHIHVRSAADALPFQKHWRFAALFVRHPFLQHWAGAQHGCSIGGLRSSLRQGTGRQQAACHPQPETPPHPSPRPQVRAPAHERVARPGRQGGFKKTG